jgi:hypothetical protein
MKPRRILLLVLLAPAVVVIVEFFRHPGPGHEILALAFAVPVLVLNMWEWSDTAVVAALFKKKEPAPAAAENKAEEPAQGEAPENGTRNTTEDNGTRIP